jgi:hypothetical protein
LRGRLLHPFLAGLRQYSPTKTVSEHSPGFDPILREPIRVPDASPSGSRSAREEDGEIRLRCQFEDNEEERLRQIQAGAAPQSNFALTFHFADLEAAGMVDAPTGDPTIRVGDRLAALYEVDGTLVRAFANPPGMFATAVKPSGFGIGGKRNLLVVTFEDRIQGAG